MIELQKVGLVFPNRVAIMYQGRLVQCDTPADIQAKPAHFFVERFLRL